MIIVSRMCFIVVAHLLACRFSSAQTWEGIVVAVEDSYSESHLDEMVQLCSLEKPKPLTPPRKGIRRVFFKDLQDIPLVLSTGPLKAQAENPRSQANVQGGDVEGQAEDGTAEIDPQIEQPDADATDLVDSRDIADSLASTAASLAVEHISQEQKKGALCFLKIYRQRARNQKLERNKTLMQKICDSYFEDCLKSAPGPERRQSPDRYYWKLYLGLVPHLLACVKGLENYAFWAEVEAKKGYRGGEKQGVHKTTNELL
jgi:hypothetical protein